MTIPVVDLFAGPGGLGEGFASLRRRNKPVFNIELSAETESNAVATLRLRAFFRQFPDGHVPRSYYDFVARGTAKAWDEKTRAHWDAAEREALQITIGEPEHDRELAKRVREVARSGNEWVLIGGPPCQAYSLVGRSRNAGKKSYRAEEDPRFFLYRHYRDVVARHQPAVFVMENVRGLLSAEVDGDRIFPKILREMRRPGGKGRYNVIPMVLGTPSDSEDEEAFLIKSELYGIPQARHRVILLGIADGLPRPKRLLRPRPGVSFEQAIHGLPEVRSGLTTGEMGEWHEFAKGVFTKTADFIEETHADVAKRLRGLAKKIHNAPDPGRGENRLLMEGDPISLGDPSLDAWFLDANLGAHLNHETREHQESDLMRYAFAAAFAEVHGRSPRGHHDFPEVLAPDHKNWKSGKFVNRFKVQLRGGPSSTVTSHLSKDGHYFIHPEPLQIRSLTVREAARLQTFPDNYFFMGKRGHQFHQVGNAVPPLLARQIAEVVHSVLSQ